MRQPLPAAPAWAEALTQYLLFRSVHGGVNDDRSYPSWLRRFTREIEPCAPGPSSLTLACIDAWVTEVGDRGRSARTVRAYVGAVRGFVRWLHEECRLASNLALSMELPLTWRDATVPQHFAWDEVQTLVTSIDIATPSGLQDRAMVLLFANCGLRAAEAARLQEVDVDLERQTVRIHHRKNRGWIVMPLAAETVDALRCHLQGSRPNEASSVLFWSPNGYPYRNGTQLSGRIRRLADQAGLGRHRGAQALRRAVGTRLVEHGATLPQVALMLGHDGQASARHYVRVSMAMLAEVADNYAEVL
jgi:integrase/recombinase XerD